MKINNFQENISMLNNKEKKKVFLTLDKNSLFLKKVIDSIERERNSSKKLFKKQPIKISFINKNHKNNSIIFNEPKKIIFKNPQYFKKILNKVNTDYPKKRIDKCKINFTEFSNQNTNNTNNSNVALKVNYSFYQRYLHNTPFSKLTKNLKFPIEQIHKYNNNNLHRYETESRIIKFNGRIMFSPLTFREQNNDDTNNSKKLRENKSELYRNFLELKLKKDQIYKRKLKKNLSSNKRQILKINNEKDLRQETIGGLRNNCNIKNLKTFKIGQKTSKGNKSMKCINNKNNLTQINNINNIKEINKVPIILDIYPITTRIKPNNNNLTFVPKSPNIISNIKFKNIITIKSKKKQLNKMNENTINKNMENKENINPYFINNENINNISSLKRQLNTDNRINKGKQSKIIKNNFTMKLLNEYKFYTKDKKLTIKIHTLNNLNHLFPKNNKFELFSIQKFYIYIHSGQE